MINKIFSSLTILLLFVCEIVAGQKRIECIASNPLNVFRRDEPVVIRFADIEKKLSKYAGGGNYSHFFHSGEECERFFSPLSSEKNGI
jgi:hypothetical protein